MHAKKIDEMMEARYQKAKTYYDGEQWSTEFECPEGYIFKDENGNVINATKIVLEKKKKEYPKTYDECCEILGCIAGYVWGGYKGDLFKTFHMLYICRDAYWKIAGEEMGLGKPWEPDWSDCGNIKYTIGGYGGEINKGQNLNIHITFAFPTKEMRDAFYENFKEEIEICKELL